MRLLEIDNSGIPWGCIKIAAGMLFLSLKPYAVEPEVAALPARVQALARVD